MSPQTGERHGRLLAETSGTVRQTVARILGRWRERGPVAIRRMSVHILRPNVLAALATKAGLDSWRAALGTEGGGGLDASSTSRRLCAPHGGCVECAL